MKLSESSVVIFAANKICEMYDAASKKDPTNEEILTNLFMSHVRLGDYKQQQQTALRLYKVKPKNPYYFWAVMSVVMQVSLVVLNMCKPRLNYVLSFNHILY